jgi:hypothetical protein
MEYARRARTAVGVSASIVVSLTHLQWPLNSAPTQIKNHRYIRDKFFTPAPTGDESRHTKMMAVIQERFAFKDCGNYFTFIRGDKHYYDMLSCGKWMLLEGPDYPQAEDQLIQAWVRACSCIGQQTLSFPIWQFLLVAILKNMPVPVGGEDPQHYLEDVFKGLKILLGPLAHPFTIAKT